MNTVVTAIPDETYTISVDEARRIGDYHPATVVSKHPAFKEILDTIRPLMAPHPVVIAGGAVRDMYCRGDANLIRDYDVFVLGCSEHDVPSLQEKYLKPYEGAMYSSYIGNSRETSILAVCNSAYPFFQRRAIVDWNIMDITNAQPVDAKTLQIIFSTAPTVEKLFETFDWNLCKFAYDLHTVWESGKSDARSNRLTLNHVSNPIRTLRRGFRIQERLNIVLDVEQIETLASLILLEAGSNKRR